MDFTCKEQYTIQDLLQIIQLLRAEDGCPWDRAQDHHSIRQNLIEETYEAVEAIDSENTELLQEELGDVLMQVVFHAQIEKEQGSFNFDDVCNGVCQKLITRHPHVFGDVQADDPDQVLTNWEAIKRKTKGQKSYAESLHSVTRALPALMRSEEVQYRAAKSGFDYPDVSMALADLEKELDEVKQAMASGDAAAVDEELGDLIFSCVNVARLSGVSSEEALTHACDKFISRYSKVEQLSKRQGIEMKQSTIDQLNELWKQAKQP